jgi:hypothetical protein
MTAWLHEIWWVLLEFETPYQHDTVPWPYAVPSHRKRILKYQGRCKGYFTVSTPYLYPLWAVQLQSLIRITSDYRLPYVDVRVGGERKYLSKTVWIENLSWMTFCVFVCVYSDSIVDYHYHIDNITWGCVRLKCLAEPSMSVQHSTFIMMVFYKVLRP